MNRSSKFLFKAATLLLGLCAYFALPSQAMAWNPPLAITSFATPLGQRVYVLSQSFVGCVQEFVCSNGGCWQGNCVQVATDTAPLGTRMFGYYEPAAGRNHLFFTAIDGHIHEWAWPDTVGLAANIDVTDLTVKTGSPAAHATYVGGFTGGSVQNPTTLTGYVDSTNVEHVFYVDVNNYLRELYHDASGWYQGHVAAGNPVNALNGLGLTSQWDGNCQHIYYTSASTGDLWEDWACLGYAWEGHSLTNTGGAVTPTLMPSQAPANYLACSVYSNGQEIVWGAPTDGTGLRSVFYPAPGWKSFEFTGSYAPFLATYSPLKSVNGNPYYVGYDRNIYSPNVSSTPLSGGPLVYWPSYGITEFTTHFDASGYSHIFYIGDDRDLHEYYQAPNQTNWSTNQLTHGENYL